MKPFGARWWRDSLALRLGAASAASTLGGCAFDAPDTPLIDPQAEMQRNDDVEVNVAALDLQKKMGWNVGQKQAQLIYADAVNVDAAGTENWRTALEQLVLLYAPKSEMWRAYYVPTLFQSLIGPPDARFEQATPVHAPILDEDYARGLALRSLFEQAGFPRDTAIVVDAPGPRSLAVAAALADQFEPVTTFGNWPHPLGVVPAHETLGAALFFLPMYAEAQKTRPADAPPVFVLDSNRLLPYVDANTQFDNRYGVALPSAAALQAAGIRHILYVNSDGQQELDDLNETLTALCASGVDVRMVALADFLRADPNAGDAVETEGEEAPDTAWSWWFPCVSFYWYGGAPFWHWGFWHHYGWYDPARPPHSVTVGPPTIGPRRPTRIGTALPPSARPVMRTSLWRPAARPTLWSGLRPPARTGILPHPVGFGRVFVRTARSDGHLTGVRPGLAGSYAPMRPSATLPHTGAVPAHAGNWGGRSMVSPSSGHYGSPSYGGFGRSGSLGRVGGGGFSGG
jgi:hypothetical protein